MEIAITAIICLGIWWLINKARAHQQPKRETAPYDASAPYIPRQGLMWVFTLGQLRQMFGSDEPTDDEWRKAGVEFYRMMVEGSMGGAADASMWSLLKPDQRAAMIDELVGHFGPYPDVGADIGHALFSTDPKVYWPILAELMCVRPGEVVRTDKPRADTMGASMWAILEPHLRDRMCETAAEQFKLNPEVGIAMMRSLLSTDRRHIEGVVAAMERREKEIGLAPITTKPASAYDSTHEEINKAFTPEELREIFGRDNPAIADWERLGVEYGPGFVRRLMLHDKLYWDWVISLRREKRLEPSDLVRDFESPQRQQHMAHLAAHSSESDEAAQLVADK